MPIYIAFSPWLLLAKLEDRLRAQEHQLTKCRFPLLFWVTWSFVAEWSFLETALMSRLEPLAFKS